MKLIIKAIFIILAVISLPGCTTTGDISEVDRSLLDIRTAVVAIVGDIRETSQNRREFYSQYFSAEKDPYFDPFNAEERLYAHVTVLGDRRPYEIKVDVVVEQKNDDNYQSIGSNPEMTEKIITAIKDRLNQRSDDRPVIDVFRPF